jgi:prepilin-type processing-associated H-X9-DG protein
MIRPASDRRRPRRSAGFTPVELLTVIAVIGVRAALLMPAVQSAREAARRSQCKNNLKQAALATHQHADVKGRYPSGVDQSFFATAPVYRGASVFVQLLPFIEQANLDDKWVLSDPIVNAQGGAEARTAVVLPWLVCPSDHLPQPRVQERDWTYALTSYGGNGGSRAFYPETATTDGIFHTTGQASEPRPNQEAVRPADVRDGTSQTLLFGERYHRDPNFETFASAGWIESFEGWGWWAPSGGRTAIGHVTMSAAVPINFRLPFAFTGTASAALSAEFKKQSDLRLNAWGSGHPGGANFAFADGSVRFLKDTASPETLRALGTRKGREVVDGSP